MTEQQPQVLGSAFAEGVTRQRAHEWAGWRLWAVTGRPWFLRTGLGTDAALYWGLHLHHQDQCAHVGPAPIRIAHPEFVPIRSHYSCVKPSSRKETSGCVHLTWSLKQQN